MSEREQYIALLRKMLNYDFYMRLTKQPVFTYAERLAIHREIANNSDFFRQGEIPIVAVDLASKMNEYSVVHTSYKENQYTTILEVYYIQNEEIIAHEKFKK